MSAPSSPKHLAFYGSALVSILNGVLTFVAGLSWLWMIVFILVSFIASYLVFRALMERFIYKKIKVIYKNINQFNSDFRRQKKSKTTSSDPVEAVSEDVLSWARARNAEITELKNQETFRREFVGNVSHELKTPIFQIQGYIHTLLEGALSDPKVNYTFLKKSAKSVDRLAELVKDLTTINFIESKELEMSFENFEMVALVEEVFEGLEVLAEQHQATLLVKNEDGLKFMVYADRSRIKQVLTNLISNAIKYGKRNGIVRCSMYDLDAQVLIEVSDDGEGISEEALPRLFERFYRVDQSRNREAGGSGLGLSIAKHIIEAHGQNIQVRSQFGTGTTFSFNLNKQPA
ncbi:MAG: two-component system phosphate regulon sensor histidine kinase PhoR [Bacteroidia bacterium]